MRSMEPCPEALLALDALPGAMEKAPGVGRVRSCRCWMVAGGRLVGMLTLENIGETLMVRAALRQARLHY
jgi:hypothetical protein